MKKARQLNLFKKDLRYFGGSLLYGKRKSIRPLSTKEPIHIVLRSSWAYGGNSFLLLKNKKDIERIIQRTASKYHIKVYRRAIVSNHLHLIIKISSRKNYQTFVRVLSSLIASHVMKMQSFKVFQKLLFKNACGGVEVKLTKQRAGDPPKHLDPCELRYRKALQEIQGKGQAFWQFRPFTRVLYWGNDFKDSCAYLLKNVLEAIGFISYTERKTRYRNDLISIDKNLKKKNARIVQKND